MIEALVYGAGGALWAMFGYQVVLAAWGWRVRPSPVPSENLRIAVLVPAHDEERAIGRLLESLRTAHYPRENLRVLVIADHCGDGTAGVVAAAGMSCLERHSGARGKAVALGDGLAWLEREMPGWAQAIAFVDADNVVHPEFFRQAAGRMTSGAPVVQGHVGIANPDVSVFARLNHINATVENRFKELARSQAGLTCQLRGHGMLFRADLFDRFSWQGDSLVEDKGLVVRLVLAGLRVEWEENARVDSFLPTTTAEAAAQRRRWAGGKSAVAQAARGALFGKAWRDRDMVSIDLLVDLLMPSHAVQLSLVAAVALAAAVLVGPASPAFLSPAVLITAYAAYFLLGAWRGGVPPERFLKLAVSAPFYIGWRTWIYLTRHSGTQRWR